MINIEKLLESKRIEVTFMDYDIDKEFVKSFRKEFQLTQIALANILGVTKKSIEKWEQGKNNISGSSAVLLKLLKNNPELMSQLYSVKYEVKGKSDDNYKLIESKIVKTHSKASKTPMVPIPLVAML